MFTSMHRPTHFQSEGGCPPDRSEFVLDRCPRCGAQPVMGDRFCRSCGLDLESLSPPAPATFSVQYPGTNREQPALPTVPNPGRSRLRPLTIAAVIAIIVIVAALYAAAGSRLGVPDGTVSGGAAGAAVT